MTAAEKSKYKEVIKAFDDFCKPRKNEVYESFVFHSRNQTKDVQFDSFLMDIKKLVKTCGFDQQEDRMLRNRIVIGIDDKQTQKKMLEMDSLDLEKAIKIGRASEVTKQQTKEMQKQRHTQSTSTTIDAVNLSNNKYNMKNKGSSSKVYDNVYKNFNNNNFNRNSNFNNNNRQINSAQHESTSSNNFNINNKNKYNNNSNIFRNHKCSKCNYQHDFGQCRAYGKTCSNCNGLNHFAVVCKSKKKIREIHFQSSESEDEFQINILEKANKNTWHELVRIEDSLLRFKLDTGAEVNVLPYRYLKKLKNFKLRKNKNKLQAYGGTNIESLGQIQCVCLAKNSISMLTFEIIDTLSSPILGLDGCLKLNLIKRIESVEKNLIKENFITNNIDVFTGLGCFVKNFKLHVQENATPVVRSARRVPQTLLAPLKNTLDKLIEKDVIAEVNEPTDWVSNLVIVEKPNKSLRLCLDPKELNLAIKSENYLIPTLEELSVKLANKKFFTVFDIRDGYHQIKLDKASSLLCTFSTPFGCYRYKRLPFGIKTCTEIYQKLYEKNFENIPGVIIYIDDILIAAETIEQHDKIVNLVIERARKLNIRFNKEKLQYRVESVKYLGQIISENGIACDPERMQAISKIEPPKDKKDLQKLLGMVNYIRSYVPNLAEMSQPLRELLKKNIVFNWLPSHDKCLQNIKKLIIKSPTLKTFDVNKDITIQTDASKYGLGCCVMQDGKPISFASRSMTETEINYPQIDKEMLAIVFSCTKFHNYIYGRKVNVVTDHQPLVSIMKKELNKIP